MPDTIKFAVCGLGYIGKRHAAIISGHEDCELVAGCDIDPEKESASLESGGRFFADLNSLLMSGVYPDVVTICTPNALHGEQALRALEAGCHVVVEKPMDIDPEVCKTILDRSEKLGKKVFCVMQNRYSPPSQWLKQIVQENRLGKIFMVQVNCYWNRDDRYYSKSGWKGSLSMDGGPLFTQFSHFMDLLYWLFGDLSDIQSSFSNFQHSHSTEFEDSGSVNFRLNEGGMGAFHYSTCAWNKNFESSLVILGEKGTIKVGGQYMDKVEYCHIQDYEMPVLPPSNPPNNYGEYTGSAANHHYIFDNVVKTLRGESTETTNAFEGYKVVEIIDRIYQQRNLQALR